MVVRSLIFVLLFYLWSTALALLMLPLLLAPRSWMSRWMAAWGAGVIFLLRPVCGIRVVFRGLEHLPQGAGLIAAKHQCMFDTMGPLTVMADPCYVMRDNLLRIPFYGWYCAKAGMIGIDREAHAKALRGMLADAKNRLKDGRQLVIFPEGHRGEPGVAGDYKPGVAALYRTLDLPCTPMATNSGVHWPAHGFLRRPGLIVYEFLPPIPPGLKRDEFMRRLQSEVEAASNALLAL
jgi:1-acyl-sn-glycerol-3-phosphate acyltransferase